jgi:septal ring factor EnvC (AmiA/AmiB activator)
VVNFPVDVSLLIGIMGCIFGAVAFFDGRRKLAMSEGKHLEEVRQLKEEAAAMKVEVKALQFCTQTTEADIREIKTDLTWIKAALSEIKERLSA